MVGAFYSAPPELGILYLGLGRCPVVHQQLVRYQPQIRYLLLEEHRYDETELKGLQNVAAALFRLENSRRAEDIEQVIASLVEWLKADEQAPLRKAFVAWLSRVLLPARVPDTEILNLTDLSEMRSMLAERVKTWTEQWQREGFERGVARGVEQGLQLGEAKVLRRLLIRRFGPLPAEIEQRLRQATEAELETWADRVLECERLDEVVG